MYFIIIVVILKRTVTGAVCATSGVGGRMRGLGFKPWFSVTSRLHGNCPLKIQQTFIKNTQFILQFYCVGTKNVSNNTDVYFALI